MNEIINLISKVDQYSFLVSFFIPIITWLFGFFSRGLSQRREKEHIRNILKFNSNKCSITTTIVETKIEGWSNSEHFTTYEGCRALINIANFIILSDLQFDNGIEYVTHNNTIDNTQYNKVCIGGPSANDFTRMLLTRYVPNVCYEIPSEVYNNESNAEIFSNNHIFVATENNHLSFLYGNKNEKIRYDIASSNEDYIVFIRLTDSSFKDKNHGTIHVIFGGRSKSAYVASKILLNRYKKIYDFIKKHKSQYFIAIKYYLDSEEIEWSTLLDLTDYVF